MATVDLSRFCFCCTPAVSPAPAGVHNRPGLAAIDYRIGTFATFRQTMVERIHTFPELAALLTREPDDHAMTMLELFAALGDVLTFYNERIANEMYLGQALHQASVEQLVGLVGYLPRPALSATGPLSFEIENGKAPRLRKGLKVMSVPGPDETAQIFETLEAIVASGRLSAAPAFAAVAPINALAEGRRRAPVVEDPGLAVGDRFVVFGDEIIEEKAVEAIETGPAGTYLSWSPGVQRTDFHPRAMRALASLRRLRLFGHDAPASHNVYDTNASVPPQQRWRTQSISGVIPASTAELPLERKVDDLSVGAHLLLDAGPSAEPRLVTARVTATSEAAASLGPLSDTVTHVTVRKTVSGRPVASVVPDGTGAVLVRTGAGYPAGFEDDGTPSDLSVQGSPPLAASSDLAGVASAGSRYDLFVRDAEARLRQRVYTPASDWGPWLDLGAELTSAPTAIALAAGQVLAFARGPEAELLMFDATGSPSAPAALEGTLASAPAVVTPDGVRMAVFARFTDDALWWRHHDGLAWAEWERLGVEIDGTPAAAVGGAGRVDVFARSRGGGLLHFREGPTGWMPAAELGGDAAGDPAAAGGVPDWVVAAVRTREDRLAFMARVGETVSEWIDQGGALGDDPSISVASDGVLVAVRRPDATVATTRLDLGLPSWVSHGDGFDSIPERRETRLYEIGEADLAFRAFDYPDRAQGSRLVLPLAEREDPADPEGLGPLTKGRAVIACDGPRTHRASVVSARAVSSAPGGRPDHLEVNLSQPLPAMRGHLTLMGNVAEASHGETQREDALGSGDAAMPFQSFDLPPGTIAHLPRATGTRPVPQVELRVDGVRWQEVPFLYGRDARERVFTLRQPADVVPVVAGGDGHRAGARFPTGALNVRLTRRIGAGLAGNLKTGQLSIALEKPVGMKAVTNPLPTSGGAAGETAEDARRAAPDGVRTFGRIVSLEDFAALATASGLAARASVTWVWNRMERTAHLTVAGPLGAPLSRESLTLLHEQLTASRDPNRSLMIANMVRVPIVVQAKILRDPAHDAEAVAEAARDALVASFDFANRGIGRAVHLSDAFATLQASAGVVAVDIDVMHLKDRADLTADERAVRSVTADPVQPHIRLYAARPTPADPARIDRYQAEAFAPEPPPAVLPAEQAYIADPTEDLVLTVVEAL